MRDRRQIAIVIAAVAAAINSACATVRSGDTAAGLYLIDQMEMAGALDLRPDGRFGFAFDYGAVSETSSGVWSDDGTIKLTTDPMPPPAECNRGFGSACFDGTRLQREGGSLILYRWETRIVLKPVQPRPR